MGLKVLVAVKRVIDYAVKIRVVGGKVETLNVKVILKKKCDSLDLA